MLTAAQMLGNASASTAAQAAAGQYQKRVVFAAVAGEPWGLQGTRRLLLDMARGSNGTHGLLLELVQQVCIREAGMKTRAEGLRLLGSHGV